VRHSPDGCGGADRGSGAGVGVSDFFAGFVGVHFNTLILFKINGGIIIASNNRSHKRRPIQNAIFKRYQALRFHNRILLPIKALRHVR
jgi:hypothetical protein